MNDTGVLQLPLPDAPARAKIVADLEANLLVEAGAGSGKTTALLARMVALLETGTARADELAAVTFTRKAAGELRERFQAAIEERLALLRAAGAAHDVPIERLGSGLDEIDRAFIGTIHAFCGRLLRERPLEVGLDPAFEEMEPEERLTARRRFWRAYLERLTRDADPMLEDLARAGLKPLALYELFDDVVENPDVDFPADAAALGSPDALAAARVELEAIIERAWAIMPERVPERDWDSLQKKLRALRFSLEVTGWTEPADLYDAIGALCKPGPNGHTITQNRWTNAAAAVALRNRVNAFAVGDTAARDLYLGWLAFRYALAVRLARQAALEFAAHRRRVGRLDFQDLLVFAADLLRSNPDVRRDLGGRYRRLLVDEFQDTDPLQAEIMLLLASEPESVDQRAQSSASPAWHSAVPRPGALFVVGDPKQSIYRFRRADIQLYGLVKDRFRAFGHVLELTSNFRSRPCIGDVVNELFSEVGYFPAAATPEQASFEPLNTRPPREDVVGEGVFTYDIAPLKNRQDAAARDDAGRLSAWIRGRVDRGERQPGDFLLLTRQRARLEAYARALESHDIPVEVTGAGVGAEEEIRELAVVLECMIDPTNSVKVVATLVGLCFGIDYDRMIAHRLEGGGFDVMHPGERGHPDVLAALRVLHGWWQAGSAEPADVFVPRLASEIGLLPLAAAGELGAVRAGAFIYALDAIRASALAGDASLPGALSAIESALELAEAEAPLEPARPDVVRLMNLHQAKGLEAKVVVLADPVGDRDRPPRLHVQRGADGRAVGYASVFEATEGWGSGKDIARPVEWEAMAEVENLFEAAEAVRLLYVAVTRAKEELVVARWRDKPEVSPWKALHPWLDKKATPLALQPATPRPRAELATTAEDIARTAADAAAKLSAMRAPTYVHYSVTGLAKAPAVHDEPIPPQTASRSSDEELRGYAWGSAVHGALAAAARAPGMEPLRGTCRDLLVEHGRPLDDHGEPLELDELAGLVRAVQASELWSRAMRAERVLHEVSFAVPGVPGALASVSQAERDRSAPSRARPQLDLFGGARRVDPNSREPLTLLEGVIDLVFRESDGWVVADYKTDVGTDPEFAVRAAAYKRQVELYAEAWSRLTGDPVKERVLFFTAQGRTESW